MARKWIDKKYKANKAANRIWRWEHNLIIFQRKTSKLVFLPSYLRVNSTTKSFRVCVKLEGDKKRFKFKRDCFNKSNGQSQQKLFFLCACEESNLKLKLKKKERSKSAAKQWKKVLRSFSCSLSLSRLVISTLNNVSIAKPRVEQEDKTRRRRPGRSNVCKRAEKYHCSPRVKRRERKTGEI